MLAVISHINNDSKNTCAHTSAQLRPNTICIATNQRISVLSNIAAAATTAAAAAPFDPPPPQPASASVQPPPTTASTKTLFQLNTFVVLQVLERLDVLSVIAFQTVCQPSAAYPDAFQIYYRTKCQHFEFSFDALRKQSYVTDGHDQTDLLFERIGPYVQRLRIRGYLLNCDMRHMNRLLAAHCTNLRHLHLRGHRLFDTRCVPDTTPVCGLRSLKLELLSVNNEHIRRYVECNRTTLDAIDFCDVTNFPGSLADIVAPPRLRRVSVSCSDPMQPGGLIRYLATQPDLVEFELNVSLSMRPLEFSEVCANLRNVRSLKLCASNLGGHIAHIAALERLERLQLCTYDDINGLLVQLAMRNVLVELSVDGSYGHCDLDSLTLGAFVGFTRLRRLRLFSCDFVGGSMLQELGVMGGLRELVLVNCDNCSAEQLAGYVIKLDGLEVLELQACRMTQRRSELRRLQWLTMVRPALALRVL